MIRIAPLSLVAALVASSFAAPLPAQFMRLERWSYARLQSLRLELLRDCLGLDVDVRRAVAERVADEAGDTPFTVIADALLLARGEEPDDLARFRAGIMTLVLPEAVDLGQYSEVHATIRAPRTLPEVGSCVLELELVDAEGEHLATRRIEERTAVADLLRARPTAAFGLDELDPGRYRIDTRILVDGEGPRPFDVEHGGDFWILPGFKERAEALPVLLDRTQEHALRAERLASRIPESRRDPLSQAILTGALWQVDRVYNAEPDAPGADPVVELRRAERIYENLCADRPALHGVSGRMTIGVPADRLPGELGAVTEVCLVTLDVPAADDSDAAKPLCMFVPGAPSWNVQAQRPSTPETTVPQWLREELDVGGFEAGEDFHVVVVESPGRFESSPRAVSHVAHWVRRLLPVDAERVVWVGEREGAYAVSRAAVEDPEPPQALVLVAGGLLTAADLESHPDLRVLAVPAAGHPSTTALRMLPRLVEGDPRVSVLDDAGVPWPIAVGLRAKAIEEFVRRVVSG